MSSATDLTSSRTISGSKIPQFVLWYGDRVAAIRLGRELRVKKPQAPKPRFGISALCGGLFDSKRW